MKEGNGVKGQEKVAPRQISLEERRKPIAPTALEHSDGDTDWQTGSESQDALSPGERITLNVLFLEPLLSTRRSVKTKTSSS